MVYHFTSREKNILHYLSISDTYILGKQLAAVTGVASERSAMISNGSIRFCFPRNWMIFLNWSARIRRATRCGSRMCASSGSL